MANTAHIAQRPNWDCLARGKPWPCRPSRSDLTAELDSVQLAIHCWGVLQEAAGDMPTAPAEAMFTRFLAWTR